MMKKLLLSAATLLFCTSVSAQQIDECSEISFSYGLAPTTTWINAYNDALIETFTGLEPSPTSWGVATVGYNFRFSKKLSLGFQVSYSSNKDEISFKGQQLFTIHNRYWSLMPNLKYNWFKPGGVVSLYSRVGAGILFGKSTSEAESESESHFAFQFSPLGIEVGRRIAAYAEVGVGMSGCVLIGARYHF